MTLLKSTRIKQKLKGYELHTSTAILLVSKDYEHHKGIIAGLIKHFERHKA